MSVRLELCKQLIVELSLELEGNQLCIVQRRPLGTLGQGLEK